MDKDTTWTKVLEIIKEQISSANFRAWFSKATVDHLDSERIVISVPSAFVKGELIRRYEDLILAAIAQITNSSLQIEYAINPSKLDKKELSEPEEDFFQFSTPIQPTSASPSPLNPKYTLDSFVVGFTNNLAYAAAQAVVQSPGVSYNPLFIYGPSGVGKTHLMQGIGNALMQKNPYAKLVYASSERFINDFIDSIQTKRTGDFRQKYRMIDIFLIDDIQFIAGKDSTQEEFFHTFNELQSKNAQIVLTSDRAPNEMQKLESRLMSRFQGGLMVDIQLPDFDTRMAILKAKLTEKQMTLPEDCLNLIAETVVSNTRELEGKLIQILQMIKLTGQEPTIEVVQKFLGNTQAQAPLIIDHKKILGEINTYFNVRTEDIIGPRRQKQLVLPRQIAMFLMYEECNIPMEKIGQILGGRDHTTVLHGIEKIREAISRDREIQRLVIEVKQALAH